LQRFTDSFLKLDKPPPLVVRDRKRIVSPTAFTRHPDAPHEIRIDPLVDPDKRQRLKSGFADPERLHPEKSAAASTAEAAVLVATNSIRGSANRKVRDRIRATPLPQAGEGQGRGNGASCGFDGRRRPEPLVKMQDDAFNQVGIGLLGTGAGVPQAHLAAHLIEEFWRLLR
jgi:hypothetical protein